MDEHAWLAERFEANRAHLRAVAYRMLGSLSEADDAVQETWQRLSRTDSSSIENLGGWLTTVVARVCLNMLRSRTSRREESLDTHVPDPIVTRDDVVDPEHEALLADSVGLALMVVLETLAPAERLAFVLHDMFAMPFDEIAAIVGRSPDATRQLASRARRRMRGAAAPPDADVSRQREVVDAFFAAARGGDFDALVAVLDPDVVLRSDGGALRPAASAVVRGAPVVAGRAITFAQPAALLRPALVNGAAGVVVTARGHPVSVMAFTVTGGRIVTIDVLADPERAWASSTWRRSTAEGCRAPLSVRATPWNGACSRCWSATPAGSSPLASCCRRSEGPSTAATGPAGRAAELSSDCSWQRRAGR